MAFRSSHYFVSYLSEMTALAAGVDKSASHGWVVPVTNPWHVELPRSLVDVVIHWNIPMHTWLKTCKRNSVNLIFPNVMLNLKILPIRCISCCTSLRDILCHSWDLRNQCFTAWVELPNCRSAVFLGLLHLHRTCHATKTSFNF